MKKLFILSLLLVGSVAVAQQEIGLNNLNREDYTITNDVVTHSRSNKIWILFIPIGGKSETKRKEKAYKRALKECQCDGLINPLYSERKVIIPLILVNFVHRSTTVKGKGYKIKVG
jgi:hypothetical protein